MVVTAAVTPATIEQLPIPLRPLGASPLVSVLMANHNYGRYLADAVESVLCQTYPNWELVICDDGSSDESFSVLARLRQRDPRIIVLFKENGGQASAWNRAFEAARGDIVSLLDADDWDRSDRLERIIERFRERSRAGLLYHRLQPANDSGTIQASPIPDNLPDGWLHDAALANCGYLFHATAALAMRRELADHLFPIPAEIRNYGDVYIALTSVFLTEIASVPESLTCYRQHSGSHSGGIEGIQGPADDATSGVLAVVPHQRRFLSEKLGEEVSSRVRISDMPYFWEKLAALYVLHGMPGEGVKGFSRREIAENLPSNGRRYAWTLLFSLPEVVSRLLLRIWMSPAWWKRIVRPITSRLDLREEPAV